MPPLSAAQTLDTPEFKRLRQQLTDPEWRIDNLYKIVNEHSQLIPYQRNEAQRAYDRDAWYRNALPKARRLGFSTHIGIKMLDRMVFVPNTRCGVVDLTLDDAEAKLRTLMTAYRNLPLSIRNTVKLIKPTNQGEMSFSNGSSIAVGVSHRGGGLNWLHASEFGRISAINPEAAKEIRTGGFPAVPQGGRIDVESTAHGTSGEFSDMVKAAQKKRDTGQDLTPLDFKLLFFGWWMKPEYRLQPHMVGITQELREYFRRLHIDHGIALDPEQQAWYAKTIEDYGPDDMMAEYPSSVEECFFNSRQGTFFKDEMAAARRQGRIGQPVPYDPTRRVNTFWDIGEDCTAIGFHQSDGYRHRIIDYYEEEGGSLQRAAKVLDEKREKRGFIYGTHIGPHDLEERDWANTAQTRTKTALSLGIKFEVIPRVQHKENSIDAARRLLPLTAICSEFASLLVDRLDNYHKKWNKLLSLFTSEPVHDEACHGADAVQQLAMWAKPEKLERSSTGGKRRPSNVSQWGG